MDSTSETQPILLDIKAAAKHLGTSSAFLRRLVWAGRIEYILIGNRYKFKPEFLNEWISKEKVTPTN